MDLKLSDWRPKIVGPGGTMPIRPPSTYYGLNATDVSTKRKKLFSRIRNGIFSTMIASGLVSSPSLGIMQLMKDESKNKGVLGA